MHISSGADFMISMFLALVFFVGPLGSSGPLYHLSITLSCDGVHFSQGKFSGHIS